MKVEQLLKKSRLPKEEAIFVLMALLGCERHKLFERPVSEDEKQRFLSIEEKRISDKMPLQYLLEKAFFCGLEFDISSGAFIPRQETELLVEEAVAVLKTRKRGHRRCLDLGAGIGNIPLAILNRVYAEFWAIEFNSIAYNCAIKNYRKLKEKKGVKGHLELVFADFFELAEVEMVQFKNMDLIISNPPYLSFSDADKIQWDVKQEPFTALFASDDGLFCYPKIFAIAKRHLKPDGWIICEIPEDKTDRIKEIARGFGISADVKRDLTGRDRIFVGRFKG